MNNPSQIAKLPRRPYGREGIPISIIGFPGLALNGMPQESADRLVADALARGVNYFETAPTYGDAEPKLGVALRPYRRDVFLGCKTTKRSAVEARKELDLSLQHLGTDWLDLYQLHAIMDVAKDVDAAFARGGAMEVFLEAKKEGRVRHIGFSAHSVEAAFAALDRYEFDSFIFPVNFACCLKGNFGPQVLARAQSQRVTLMAIKALARQSWPKGDPLRKQYPGCWYQPLSDRAEADLGLRFTLSQPVTAALPPADASLLRLALEIAGDFRPITESEFARLKSLAANLNPIFTAPAA